MYNTHTLPPPPPPSYLLMCLERPVLLDAGVTEVADLIQHGVHESGAQVLSVGGCLHAILVSQVFPGARVVVERRETVQEITASLHVPERTEKLWIDFQGYADLSNK